MWRLKCCRMWTEDNILLFIGFAQIRLTRLLAGRYDPSDRGSSHEKILQGRSRLDSEDFHFHVRWVRWGWVRVPRLDEGCLKLLVPFRMACHALNASWDMGLTNYNHDRRPSTGSSPSATTGRSDEASRYPSDATAQSRQSQIITLTHDVHIYI